MTTKTISTTYANGYALAAKYSALSITSAGAVNSAAGAAATSYGGYGGSAGVALSLPHGGSLTNAGHVQGGTGGAGGNASVYAVSYYGGGGGGGGAGVFLSAHGSVANSGFIGGGNGGAGGAGSPGYYYPGGGVSPGGPGGNGGNGANGVTLKSGGGLTNTGTIVGGVGGAGGAPGNAYTYYGFGGVGGSGVVLDKAGSVTNLGTIRGGYGGYGGGYANANNGYYADAGDGVFLAAGGTVTNGSAGHASAVISGQNGVALAGPGTVINFGIIEGEVAVAFKSAGDVLVVEAGSAFYGKVLGDGDTIILASGDGVITGFQNENLTVSGSMVKTTFNDFGVVEIGKGASFSDAGSVSIVAGQDLVNAGDLKLSGPLANLGLITADGGFLTVNGAVTGAGAVDIAAGVADFGSSFSEKVDFTGSTGKLELGKSRSYGGEISGFSKTGATTLDLRDIDFVSGTTKASYSGTASSGTLTVRDGTQVAKIELIGDYLGSTFKISGDGHGGTLVWDPAAMPASGQTTASSQRFVDAMAGFGAVSGASLTIAEASRQSLAPLVASPRMAPIA